MEKQKSGKSQQNRRTDMKAILSADRNWGIGYQNRLLVTIPSDMRFFRETTMGKVIVLGRKTLETFPNGMPLSQRVNIVLTHDRGFQARGATIVHSEKELMEELEKYPREDIYVVGGGSVYELLLPYCDTAYVTRIDMEYQADTFFPNLDQDPGWEMISESEEQTCFDIEYRFTTYRRK